MTVTSLGDPDDAVMIDDSCGILCNANYERNELVLPLGDMEVQKGNPNRKLVEDYSYWFWDNR